MDELIRWCGFLGGWLLVAGPIYQAALELGEQDVERAELGPRPAGGARISPWWWLLPPVGYWKQRQRSRRVRREVMVSWTAEQLHAFVQFANKATGWLLVAAGAGLIAVKETGELAEHHHWPAPVFALVVVVMAALSTGYTVGRLHWTKDVLAQTG